MTGEMSREEVTPENYPLHFACVDAWGRDNVTVEPFDHYQGPYIHILGVGRIFGCTDGDRGYYWYNTVTDRMSGEWLGELTADNQEAIAEFCDLVENGGNPVPDHLRNPPDHFR